MLALVGRPSTSWNCDLTTKYDSSTLLRLQPHMDPGSQILLEEEIYIIYRALHSV